MEANLPHTEINAQAAIPAAFQIAGRAPTPDPYPPSLGPSLIARKQVEHELFTFSLKPHRKV
jgi:hypothetical protein